MQNYYPFLDIQRGACSVKATLGPSHWEDHSQVQHSVLQLVSSLLCTCDAISKHVFTQSHPVL